MALIDDVQAVCQRLAPHGWADLLDHHGLDITASDLQSELLGELPGIDRTVPGFEDFAFEGRRGIESGQPARSLLFHAMASPNVIATPQGGEELGAFPTPAEIEVIENYVYGVSPPSLTELTQRFPQALLAIAVFASEYRPGSESVHRRHADMCFSRTGVARVGTAEPHYDTKARGFLPFVEDDDHAIRVLPARYAPYIAVQLRGRKDLFGPMNFDLGSSFSGDSGDEHRLFWIPIHKLFAGEECVRNHDLTVNLQARHANEKIRRVHLQLRRLGHDSGWGEPDISRGPFVFSEGIAELSENPDDASGTLIPTVHERLIEPAEYEGSPLSYVVPENENNPWSPSLLVSSEGGEGFRRAPEYVHARHRVDQNQQITDLHDFDDVADRVRVGGFRALHYVDFTADGWVEVLCPELAALLPRTIPSYSIVAAPDFYPNCDQRELIEWWLQRVPQALRDRVWQTPPLTLSDERIAPNLQLSLLPPALGLGGVDFRDRDDTVTAIVSAPAKGLTAQRPLEGAGTVRHAHLPDAAAGVFAPGWDTSRDETSGATHLAAYGLGSPFPEDAKLCAALSSFWPAVAPDAGRSFSRVFPTATPLTDEEIGTVGDLSWDGVPGPRPTPTEDDGVTYEYASFDHVDYVRSALDGRFSLALTGKVDFAEYTARILAMIRAYLALEVEPSDRNWRVLSFRSVAPDDGELQNAEAETSVALQGESRYRIVFGLAGNTRIDPEDPRKMQTSFVETATLFVGTLPRILVKQADDPWEVRITS